MRTILPVDTAVLNHPASAHRVWIKVEISRASAVAWGSETWADLSDLNGFDWVLGVEYDESIDTPAWTATIRLLRQVTDHALFSLSPFISGSINNTGGVLIQPYRKVRISTAYVPMDTPRANATFNTVFLGRIDSYRMSGNEIVVECRDRTGELQDRFIESERTYGAVDPTTATAADIEEIIQNILDDHYNTTDSAPRANPLSTRTTDGVPYQLYSANGDSTTPFNTSTGFAIREYNQTKMPIWEAISRLANLIGYQLRFRYHEGSGINDFVLVLEEPDRAASGADFTLDPNGGIVDIASVSLSNQDVRNFVRVSYPESGTVRTSTETSDATSITKYGRRFMEVQEGSTSQIDTSTEANKMRDAFLGDLKEPQATVELRAPYLWFAQLNDLVGITADNFYFDSNQELAILSRRNSLSQGGRAVTTLVCQGLPKTGVRKHVSQHRLYSQPSFDNINFATGFAGELPNGDFSDFGHG